MVSIGSECEIAAMIKSKKKKINVHGRQRHVYHTVSVNSFLDPRQGIQECPGSCMPRRGFQILDSEFFVSGIWIPDFMSYIPDTKLPGFRNLNSLTFNKQ